MRGDEYSNWFHEWATDPAKPGTGRWRLRWLGLRSPAVEGRWQVTTIPPVTTLADWDRPAGLVASGRVDAPPRDDATVFEIDFTAFAPAASAPAAPAPGGRTVVATPPGPTYGRRLTGAYGPAGGDAGSSTHALAGVLAGLAPLMGVLYYIRVVPLGTEGRLAGPPSNPVVVRYGTPGPGDVIDIRVPTQEELNRMRAEAAARDRANASAVIDRVQYQPERLQAGDAPYHYLVTRDFLTWKEGERIHVEPSPDGNVLDDVAEAVGDGVDFLVDALDWVSNAYDDLKAGLVNAVADVLPSCDPDCRFALRAGLEAGLAAMGFPPSIPDSDELAAMGRGYLAQTLADEAARRGYPIPPEALDVAFQEFEDNLREAADHGPSGDGWLRPDPLCQGSPAIVTVNVRSQRDAPITGLFLDVWMSDLYRFTSIPLPTLLPGGSLDVPVVLTRDMESWRWTVQRREHHVASEAELLDEWRTYYTSGHASITAWLREGAPHAPHFVGFNYKLDGSPPFPYTCPS